MTDTASTPPLTRRRAALAYLPGLGVLLLLILLVYNKLVLRGFILARGDTYLYFYPYWTAARAALRAGRLPLWNPDLFMGVPFLANSQVGLFYPFNWLVWLLWPAPYAVTASVVLHLFIAGAGAYIAARRTLGLSHAGAFLTAILFSLGGYLTAQVEHVNQLQGLAWLPWIMTLAWGIRLPNWRAAIRRGAGLACLLALQLLAGHTQTSFITGVGLLLWLGTQLWQARRMGEKTSASTRPGHLWMKLGLMAGLALLLALLVSAIQVWPTLELAGLSRRSGGLPGNEALSFSLHPLLFAPALLPRYGSGLYIEYSAHLPLVCLALALMAGLSWRHNPRFWPAIVLSLAGLFLALGLFNPLYHFGLVHLPGFNLFRAPARWLALYAFGASLLAGAGWDSYTGRVELANEGRYLRLTFGIVGLLTLATVIAAPLARALAIPLPPESPLEMPSTSTLIVWGVILAVVYFILPRRWGVALRVRRRAAPAEEPDIAPPLARLPRVILAITIFWGLFGNARALSLQRFTADEAYFDIRPATARLQAATQTAQAAHQPPGRYLSISQGTFDPGDKAEIETIYADLPAGELYLYLVTVKEREIVAPNLSLTYGLTAVDGFDGGLLPLPAYSDITRLLAPEGLAVVDGRLRESLKAVPEERWLDLFNVRYLITDKTADQWVGDGQMQVFFDLQHPVVLQPGQSLNLTYLPDYEATGLWLLGRGAPGRVVVEQGQNTQTAPVVNLQGDLYETAWQAPFRPTTLRLEAGDAPWSLDALALVDRRDSTFYPLVAGNYRLMHSGDVKIYENLDALPRAFWVGDWLAVPDEAAAVARMAQPDFDPARTAVVSGDPAAMPPVPSGAPTGVVTMTHFAAEQMRLTTVSEAPGLLVISDAAYPGWEATVDGAPVELVVVDGLFKGVWLPAGRHEVVLVFRPVSLLIGLALSLLGTTILAGVWLGTRRATSA